LVDDAQTERRDPSHSAIEHEIKRAGLSLGDPNKSGPPLGKEKRVRGTLGWAMEHNYEGGQCLLLGLISTIRGCGGFREESPNYVGRNAIEDAANAFRSEGFLLSNDGELLPLLLDNLSGAELTAALEAYVRRAKKGAADAALVTGTGKDLLEATATHILTERSFTYDPRANFPALLGMAFVALGLATTQHKVEPDEQASRRVERAIYESACAVNNLRNREGTGHGRPWLPTVTESQARLAIELMGAIAEFLIASHKSTP
jgi:hypothetical protein